MQNSEDFNDLTLSLHEMMSVKKETKFVNDLLINKVFMSCFLEVISSFNDMMINSPPWLDNDKGFQL